MGYVRVCYVSRVACLYVLGYLLAAGWQVTSCRLVTKVVSEVLPSPTSSGHKWCEVGGYMFHPNFDNDIPSYVASKLKDEIFFSLAGETHILGSSIP
jgi:hypothetical protein